VAKELHGGQEGERTREAWVGGGGERWRLEVEVEVEVGGSKVE